MKDAFGGIVNIMFIAVFLLAISGILALIVNYNKAFQMKNIAISAIEEYEGSRGCFSTTSNGDTLCRQKIEAEAKEIGYHPTFMNCNEDDGYSLSDNYFCWKRERTESGNHWVYRIITQVDIDFPIVNRLTGLSIFQVHGDTRPLAK